MYILEKQSQIVYTYRMCCFKLKLLYIFVNTTIKKLPRQKPLCWDEDLDLIPLMLLLLNYYSAYINIYSTQIIVINLI